MSTTAAVRAARLAEEIQTVLFGSETSEKVKFLSMLQVAQYLAESVLRENRIALTSLTKAKGLILDDANIMGKMSEIAASKLQDESLIQDKLALWVINFAINKSDRGTQIDEANFMAKIKIGLELLIASQPDIEWERRISHQIINIAKKH